MIHCIVIEDEPHAQESLVSHIEKIDDLKLVGVFDNALKASPFIDNGKIDLVFSDIQMPDLDGISFLRGLDSPPKFIFITGNPSYALEGYELNVVDYILKPFSLERFVKAVNKARALLRSENKSNVPDRDFLIIKDRSSMVIVPYKEVFFIKSDKDYIRVSTMEKDYTMYRKLSEIEDSLSSAKQFLRVQKSYIVNLDYAKTVEGNHIKMKGSIEDIPIGGQYKAELFRRLGVSGS